MSHENNGGGAVIILSVAITEEVAESLDNMIGHKGDSREEVASHYVSRAHGGRSCRHRESEVGPAERPQKPEEAAPAAEQATGDGADQVSDETTPPGDAPDGGPQAND